MQRLYTCLLSFTLTIGACVVGLILFEAGLRLFNPQILEIHPNGMWQLSDTRGCQLTPGFDGDHTFVDFTVRITINKQGFRDRSYGPKPPGVFRILTIGDSFTFGLGVDQHEVYSKVLESILNKQTAQTFEVINGGAPGYSTHQELILLKEAGLALEPDLVLVGFYPFNDLRDNQLPINRYALAYGYLYDEKGYNVVLQNEKSGLPIPFKGYLWAHFNAYRFLADRYHKLKSSWTYAPLSDVGDREKERADESQDQSNRPVTLTKPIVDKKTSRLFREIAEVTRGNGGQAVMLLIPDIKQVANPESMWKPQWDQYKTMASLNTMPVIDLSPVFVEANRTDRTRELWYMVNKHWKARGHRLTAETIYKSLLEQHLIP